MKEKIAVVVDSGSDVSAKLREGLAITSLPLRITIDDKTYTDGVDISAKEIFDVIDTSKVTTSLPTGEDILSAFEAIKAQGYTHIIAVTISSGLSGTYNVIRNLSQEVKGLEIYVHDTKNISLGSGFMGIRAAENINKGMSFNEIVQDLKDMEGKSQVFFTVGTLDYLIKGGRIGRVAGTVANVLNIKPVISCDPEGIYYTVTKVRGYKRVIKTMLAEAKKFIGDAKNYKVLLVNAASQENLEAYKAYAEGMFTPTNTIEVLNITPALGIHTGPEALGIAVIINE